MTNAQLADKKCIEVQSKILRKYAVKFKLTLKKVHDLQMLFYKVGLLVPRNLTREQIAFCIELYHYKTAHANFFEILKGFFQAQTKWEKKLRKREEFLRMLRRVG